MSLTAITKNRFCFKTVMRILLYTDRIFCLKTGSMYVPSPSETLEVTCGYQFLFTTLLVKAELTRPHYSLSDHQRVLMGDGHIQLPSYPAGVERACHKASALGNFRESRVRNSVHISISMH